MKSLIEHKRGINTRHNFDPVYEFIEARINSSLNGGGNSIEINKKCSPPLVGGGGGG